MSTLRLIAAPKLSNSFSFFVALYFQKNTQDLLGQESTITICTKYPPNFKPLDVKKKRSYDRFFYFRYLAYSTERVSRITVTLI
jgi:hypothetical protein